MSSPLPRLPVYLPLCNEKDKNLQKQNRIINPFKSLTRTQKENPPHGPIFCLSIRKVELGVFIAVLHDCSQTGARPLSGGASEFTDPAQRGPADDSDPAVHFLRLGIAVGSGIRNHGTFRDRKAATTQVGLSNC